MSTPHLALIGPIGGPEMIMIFVVILLLFGAKKLPELARGVGKSMGEFKKAREEFEREITRSEEDVLRDDKAREARKARELDGSSNGPKIRATSDTESREI